MVDPTATLTLSVSSSLTDTLTALRHSICNVSLRSYLKNGIKQKPATELMPGSRIRPTQSLLIVLETASIDSTKRSTVSAIAYSMIDRYQHDHDGHPTQHWQRTYGSHKNQEKYRQSPTQLWLFLDGK